MKTTQSIQLALMLSLLLAFSNQIQSQVLPADSLVLVAIYDSTDGPNWTKQSNWLTGAVPTWEGISVENNRITAISLAQAKLNGTIPNAIYNLDSLKTLTINESSADFEFTSDVSKWTILESIFLNFGNFTGDLSVFCSNSKLKEIGFGTTKFSGTIPSCLTNLELTRLNLSNLELDEAPLPDFLSQISTLKNISLANNQFTGAIPASWCGLTDLQFLVLDRNELTGAIPDCLNSDNKLNQLIIEKNDLSGDFPPALLGSNLRILLISENDFTGTLDQWSLLNSCIRFEIAKNRFEGTFDGDILNRGNILRVKINDNKFDELLNMDGWMRLTNLDVQENELDFGDLEMVESGTYTFLYSPQDSIGSDEKIDFETGQNYTLTCDAGGTMTTYQWYKGGIAIDGATSAEYEIVNGQESDEGNYHCKANNPLFPNLELVSKITEISLNALAVHDFAEKGLNLFPNPVEELVTIDLGSYKSSDIRSINLVTSTGQSVQTNIIGSSLGKLKLDLNHLPIGNYILSILIGEETFVTQLVKLK